MISSEELLREIERCQREPVTYTAIGKLADLYTVYDHLHGISEPNHNDRISEKIRISGDTNFLKAVVNMDENIAWNIMNELMTVLKISNPRLYEGVMRQLEEYQKNGTV